MRSLVIGATAGLGRALAELLARNGHDLFLVSSDAGDLAPLAADLASRHGVRAHYLACDLAAPDPEALREAVRAKLGGIENLFYIAGLSLRDTPPVADEIALRLVNVNLTSAVRLVNAFFADLVATPGANLVGIGSVAAARGRRYNSIYGAAKRGLETYFEALRHRLAGHNCKVQFYRAGYLKTRMTAGQKLPFPALDPDDAAARIVGNLGKDLGAVYLPRWWWAITAILRLVPWAVFKQLDI
jgi:short-subunit dehydrogenase